MEKQKSLDLGPKLLDLGIFGIEFEKTIVIHLKLLHLKVIRNDFLTNTVKFGIGFAFCKGLGFGPLHKICLNKELSKV